MSDHSPLEDLVGNQWQTWDGSDVMPPDLALIPHIPVDVRTAAGAVLRDIEAGEFRWFWVEKNCERYNPLGNVVAWRLTLPEEN